MFGAGADKAELSFPGRHQLGRSRRVTTGHANQYVRMLLAKPGDLPRQDRFAGDGARGNEKCADCMVHCGFEATAVHDTFSTAKGFLRTVKATVAP